MKPARFSLFPCLVLTGLLLLLGGATGTSEAEDPNWSATYGSQFSVPDEARSVAVDSAGCIYVTGPSGATETTLDYLTVKYDADGNELWSVRYDGPVDQEDHAVAVRVDSAGSVYVTGSSRGDGTQSDYATVKYDADGNELWVARYDGPGSGEDTAAALVLDPAGNVYVTGASDDSSTGLDYATVKYDNDGNQLWVARYNGPGNGEDGAAGLAVDPSGNVYVTGRSAGSGGDFDMATVSYDPGGNQVSAVRHNGSAGGPDEGVGITVDELYDVYVTGFSENTGSGYDVTTIKYDSTANVIWTALYNSPGNGIDRAVALALDPSGNLVVTGETEGDGNITIKYDPAGTELWAAPYADPGSTAALALDGAGNVYVTGISDAGASGSDYAAVKYDPDGNRIWTAQYDGPDSLDDEAAAVAVDSAGNVVVTGTSEGAGAEMQDFATVKYDAGGNLLWAAPYNGLVSGYDKPASLCVDAQRNVYVTGRSEDNVTGPDYATIKYGPDGSELWTARFTGPGDTYDVAEAIALNPAGGVYVTGTSEGAGTSVDIATIRYHEDGTELWVTRYDGPVNSHDYATALAVDGGGNVIVTGFSEGDGTDRDYITIKYDSDGVELWTARYDGPASGYDRAVAVDVDDIGQVYVTGYSPGSGTGNDYATIKYNAIGTQLWVARYDGPANSHDNATALAVDGAGNVYASGSSSGSGTGYDYATIKYDPAGTELWAVRYDGPDGKADEAEALAVDGAGNVYVTGSSMRFLWGTDYIPDFATVKYDAGGNEVWVSRYYYSGEDDRAKDLALDGQGNVIVTGCSGPYSFWGTSAFDIETVLYDASGQLLWSSSYTSPDYEPDVPVDLALDGAGGIYVTGYVTASHADDLDFVTLKYLPCVDRDQDGYADPASEGCPHPERDCDDENPAVHPGAEELCNGEDDDCDDAVPADENDLDGDNWRICEGDCDDGNAAVHPDAEETCNGEDDDCDGAVPTDEQDLDEDGWPVCQGDCDDANPLIYPGAEELCNGRDDDCDDVVPAGEEDQDGDEWLVCEGDCDDEDPLVHPEIPENCENGVDDDCDGLTDGSDPDCGGYSAVANAEASLYGGGSVSRSGAANQLTLFLFPLGAVIVLRILRRRR